MMRRFALFMFGFLLPVVHAQEAPPVNHAQSDLTVKEIVEILSDFDVKHVEQQPFFQPMYGATTFDTHPPAVWIFETADLSSKRSTVIHELLHIHYRSLGIDPPEDVIRAEEDRQYQKIFGVPIASGAAPDKAPNKAPTSFTATATGVTLY